MASNSKNGNTHQHGTAARTAVLLCNLGTPDEPTAPAVRRYLAEFLSDPRVVEIPRALWLPLLYGVILPFRSSKSAAKYQTIWTPEGSPLKVWTERQAKRLQGWLGEHGHLVSVAYAMRYGQPSIASQLDALTAAGATRILILSAYPQYSGTTTASVIDAVNAWSRRTRNIPELRFVLPLPGNRLRKLGLIDRRIDPSKNVTLFDVLAFLEIDTQQPSVDLWLHGNSIERPGRSEAVEIDRDIGGLSL